MTLTATASIPLSVPVPSLTRWGLTSDADLVFRAMATFGARDARGLVTELGMSRLRVDDALAELHECGAVRTVASLHRAALWTSCPAADVVQRLRMRRLRVADPSAPARWHRAVFETLNARLTGAGVPLTPVLAGTIGDGVRYLRTRPLARQRLAAAMAAERHDHLVINTEEVLLPETSRARPFDEDTYRRGVRFRVLARPPLDGDATDPNNSPEIRLNSPLYSYRESLDTPLKLFICDRRTAFVLADPTDVDRGYLEITQPVVIRTLVELFESRWTSAVDPRAVGVPAIALTARERDLVALLAQGHTDVTAAKQLHISARSVTNTLRALMDRLGVDNRFQLGLALGAMDVPPALQQEAVAG
jgi:DNA-binding CsgD family transcriptional regulator